MPADVRFHLRRACGRGQRKERSCLLDDLMKELDVSWELWNPHPLTTPDIDPETGLVSDAWDGEGK